MTDKQHIQETEAQLAELIAINPVTKALLRAADEGYHVTIEGYIDGIRIDIRLFCTDDHEQHWVQRETIEMSMIDLVEYTIEHARRTYGDR